jgi:hypothetical protein
MGVRSMHVGSKRERLVDPLTRTSIYTSSSAEPELELSSPYTGSQSQTTLKSVLTIVNSPVLGETMVRW